MLSRSISPGRGSRAGDRALLGLEALARSSGDPLADKGGLAQFLFNEIVVALFGQLPVLRGLLAEKVVVVHGFPGSRHSEAWRLPRSAK